MSDVITSTKNESIKSVAKLKRTRERTLSGVILVEGPNALEEAIGAGFEPTLILATEDDGCGPIRV